MYFKQKIFVECQHPHVGSELLHEDIDDLLCGSTAGHSDTLGDHVGTILEVEPHNSMELTVLQRNILLLMKYIFNT